jgi:manganese efflux pump family protein
MTPLATLVLAFSLSADAFAVATSKGAKLRHPRPLDAIKNGAIFGAVEAVAPLLGWGLGAIANDYITAVDHWIAFIILAALGAKMIHESRTPDPCVPDPCDQKPVRPSLKSLVLAAIGTSIDATGVGVTLAFIDANIWLTALTIGMATFLMASLGLYLGHLIGCKIGKTAELIGGIALIAIGSKILAEHTGLI